MTIETTKLLNGLRVATDRMDTVETVTVGAWVGVGTRHEPTAVNGIAHMLEHMAFKGTWRRTARDIAEEIEAVGGHLNAYTSREVTAYHAKVLAENQTLALDILADILQNPTFDEAELGRERTVILQEIGQAIDTPDDIIFDYFQETAYPDQALGRPVLGRPEIVGGLDRDTLKGFLESHYGTENMVVAAAGRVEHDRVVDIVAEAFGSLPRSADGAIDPAQYLGGDYRESRGLEQVHLLLGFNGVGFRDPDYYTASVLSTLLGGGMSSRLFQEVREKRGLVYTIYSFVSSYRDGGLFGIYAGTGEAEATELLPVICDQLVNAGRDAGEQEVARARAQLKAALLMSRESTGARCEQLAQQILIYGRPIALDELIAKVEAVDCEAVRRLATRLFTTRPTLAAVGPVSNVESFDRLAARLQ
jgi:predicted Zn-dependent peptidase